MYVINRQRDLTWLSDIRIDFGKLCSHSPKFRALWVHLSGDPFRPVFSNRGSLQLCVSPYIIRIMRACLLSLWLHFPLCDRIACEKLPCTCAVLRADCASRTEETARAFSTSFWGSVFEFWIEGPLKRRGVQCFFPLRNTFVSVGPPLINRFGLGKFAYQTVRAFMHTQRFCRLCTRRK